MRSRNAAAKLQGQNDLEDQDTQNSNRKGKRSLAIEIGRLTREINCLDTEKGNYNLSQKKQRKKKRPQQQKQRLFTKQYCMKNY